MYRRDVVRDVSGVVCESVHLSWSPDGAVAERERQREDARDDEDNGNHILDSYGAEQLSGSRCVTDEDVAFDRQRCGQPGRHAQRCVEQVVCVRKQVRLVVIPTDDNLVTVATRCVRTDR